MAERLIEALEADIAALERGKPAEMRTTHPEIQKLSAIYGKEAASLSPDAAKEAPAPLRATLMAVTKALRRNAGAPRPHRHPREERQRRHDPLHRRRSGPPQRPHPHLRRQTRRRPKTTRRDDFQQRGVIQHLRIREVQNTNRKFQTSRIQSLNPHQRDAANKFAPALAAQRCTRHLLYIPIIGFWTSGARACTAAEHVQRELIIRDLIGEVGRRRTA